MEREIVLSPEIKKPVESKIILQFMRHGKAPKTELRDGVETKIPDEKRQLTPAAKEQARQKGKKLKIQPEISIARGSPRQRSQETALRALVSGDETISAIQDFRKMREVIGKKMKYGNKIIADPRLNFIDNLDKEATDEAYDKGCYIEYLINESDNLARQNKDTVTTTTYTHQSGNVAELVKQYLKVGKQFNKIASSKSDYEKYGNQLERYFGTHAGIPESFLAKALEITGNLEQRDKFVQSYKGAYKETEGMRLEVINQGENQKIIIHYDMPDPDDKEKTSDKTLEIDEAVLDTMIEAKKKFETELQTLAKK